MYTSLIEIDQILLPMIAEKQEHLQSEILRMERAKMRKARKHRIEDWEEKDLDSLSDDSHDEEGKKMSNYSSDIPSGKYE